MVTMVGLHPDLANVVEGLIELEYDALAAYHTAVERFDSQQNKTQFQEFIRDHEQHLAALKELCTSLNVDVADGPDAKAVLTKGKIVIADLMGDAAILAAMKTNEDDTVMAYKRAMERQNNPESLQQLFDKAYADEVRHRAWMEQQASLQSNKSAA